LSSPTPIRWPDIAQVMAAAALWGGLGPMARALYAGGFTAGEVAALRIGICALILIAAARLWLGAARVIWRREPGWAIAHAALGVVAYNLCFFAAIHEIGVARAVTLLYSAPIWALVFSYLVLGERPTTRQIVLALVALAGVLLVVGVFDAAGALSPLGALLGLAAGAAYALYPVLGRRLMRRASPGAVMASSFVLAAVMLVFWPTSWHAVARLVASASWSTIGLLAGISVIGTLLAYVLFTRGLTSVPAATAGVVATVEPVVGILLAAVLFDERLAIDQWVGVALILIASAASTPRRRRATCAT